MSHRTLCLAGTIVLAMMAPVYGQFTQLSATDDGKQVYFVSQLLLRGTSTAQAFPETRMYRFGSDGVTLFAERGVLAPRNSFSSNDGVSGPQVTGDGGLMGFTMDGICDGSPDCSTVIGPEAELRGNQTLDLGVGRLQLSRNGKWALLIGSSFTRENSVLVDLTTGLRTSVPPPPDAASYFAFSRVVASDGTLLVQQLAAPGSSAPVVGLWKEGQFTPLNFSPVAISEDASTLISVVRLFGPEGMLKLQLTAYHIASKKTTTLFESTDSRGDVSLMAVSNSGRLVLYRVGSPSTTSGPAYIASTETGASVPIQLPAGELVTDGTLTGGGDIAFLATTAGRIVRVTVASGAMEALFDGVPHCADPTPVAPGSLARFQCNFTGTPASLQDALQLNGVAVPVLYTTSSEIGVQIPWDGHSFLGDTLTVNLSGGSASPFQAAQSVTVSGMAPRFEAADPGQNTVLGLKLIKGDWSGLLTEQPGPGDLIHAYMTGLGYVKGPMVTGAPASLVTAEPITGSIQCQFSNQQSPAETVFAGLAPGMIGIYQVTFRMPPEAGAVPMTGLSCRFEWPGGSGVFFGGGSMTGGQ